MWSVVSCTWAGQGVAVASLEPTPTPKPLSTAGTQPGFCLAPCRAPHPGEDPSGAAQNSSVQGTPRKGLPLLSPQEMQPLSCAIRAVESPRVAPAGRAAALIWGDFPSALLGSWIVFLHWTYQVGKLSSIGGDDPANGMLPGPCVFLMTHNRVLRGEKQNPTPP